MNKFQCYIMLFIFLFTITLNSQSGGRESYIDIPSAYFNKGLYVNINGSYPLGPENEVLTDINSGLEFAKDRFNAILNWYSTSDLCINLSYLLKEQEGKIPNISMGIDYITYRQYISPIGHAVGDTQNTYADEGYLHRPPEAASAYIVATRKFSDNIEMTLGIGRGRFIGYGPRSRFLNLDVFSNEAHEVLAFGVFGGLKIGIPNGPSLIIETDGRDANLGIQYELGLFKGTLSIIKLEQFAAEEHSTLTPRVQASFSFRVHSFESPKSGIINLILRDQDTDEPISGTLIYENGEPLAVNIPITGRKTINLAPGTYVFTLSAPDYKMKQAKIPIRPEQELNFTVKLKKKLTPDMASAIELTRQASEDYKNKKYKEAKNKLETALQLYPENKKANEGLELVEKAIQDKVRGLEEEARSLESVNLNRAITLWQEVLSWRSSSTVEAHIRELQNRLTSLTKPKPTKKPTPAKKRPTLSAAQIENLYKEGIKEYVKGNYSEAVKHFQRILNANPKHEGAKRYLDKAKEKL